MRQLSIAFAILLSLTLVLVTMGCGQHSGIDSNGTSGTSSPTSIVNPLVLWWTETWSGDGDNLDVEYNRVQAWPHCTTHVTTGYDPLGRTTGTKEVKECEGTDAYGRDVQTTVETNYGTKYSVVGHGSFDFCLPAGETRLEESRFTNTFQAAMTNKDDDNVTGQNRLASENFTGSILTSSGSILYSGNASGAFGDVQGRIGLIERTENTRYEYDGRLYAQTATVETYQSKYWGPSFQLYSRTVKTSTTYADGSRRQSEITVVYDRDASTGVPIGKSATGVVSGTEYVGGKAIGYTGSITIDYLCVNEGGWVKGSYHETRSAEISLPQRLPFEVIWVDDPNFAPVF